MLALPVFAGEKPITFPKQLDLAGFEGGVFDIGAGYVSGQPTEDALRKLKQEGFTTDVCIRTQPEMDDRKMVPFDEVAFCKEIGLEYIHIPFDKLGPNKVEQFQKAMSEAKGKVLLHCTVAWRATYMWMAYLVKDRKQSLDEAWKAGMEMSVTVDRSALMLDSEVTYMATPHKEGARTPKDGVISKPGSKLKLTSPKVIDAPNGDWRAFVMWDLGDILNAGQPDEKKFRELAAQGVKTVINIRAPSEMEDIKTRTGFDEEAVAKELGLKYVNIPLTSWKTFTPEALAKIADAFENAEGKILYHCNSANRTTQTLVPYLVKYQGMSLDEASKIGEQMRWNNLGMLCELLGVDISHTIKPKSGKSRKPRISTNYN
jgi:uncharacterized protein (TIGR01244 family)